MNNDIKTAVMDFLANPPNDFELELNATDIGSLVQMITIACPPPIIELLKAKGHPIVATVQKIYLAIAESQGMSERDVQESANESAPSNLSELLESILNAHAHDGRATVRAVSPEAAAQIGVPPGGQKVEVALVVNDYIDKGKLAKALEQATEAECARQRHELQHQHARPGRRYIN